LLILSAPLTVKAQEGVPIARYEDGRDLPWSMFDVKEVRLYEESSRDFILEFTFHKPLPEAAINYMYACTYIDYDSNSSTGTTFVFPSNVTGIEYEIFSYYSISPFQRIIGSYRIIKLGVIKEEESIEMVFPYDGTLKVLIPNNVFDPRESRLSCIVGCAYGEGIGKGDTVAILGLAKDRWLTMARDPYEGFPLDLKSISILWDRNKLGVRYEFYDPVPKEVNKGARIHLDIFPYPLWVGGVYGDELVKGYKVTFHLSLSSTWGWYYRARLRPTNVTEAEYQVKGEVQEDTITIRVELLKPTSFFEPTTMVYMHRPEIRIDIIDTVPDVGLWKPKR